MGPRSSPSRRSPHLFSGGDWSPALQGKGGEDMKKTRLFPVIMILAMGPLLFMTGRVEASPYAFSMDRFQVIGNLPGNVVDEFDDGVVDPWTVHDPTVIESGGLVTLSSPGTIEEIVFEGTRMVQEMTYLCSSGTPLNVENGEGDFTGVSTWVPVVPEENVHYHMAVSYELQSDPHESISIGVVVANWGTDFADYWGTPSGFGISFRRVGSIPLDEFVWKHVSVAEGDITGDILLRLNFEDDTDQFTADFSLDGGATFESPFEPIGWGRETPGQYRWHFSAISSPEPSSALLQGTALLVLMGLAARRKH